MGTLACIFSIILQYYQCLVCVKIIQKAQVNILIQVSEKDNVKSQRVNGKTAEPRITDKTLNEIGSLYLSVINSVYNIT